MKQGSITGILFSHINYLEHTNKAPDRAFGGKTILRIVAESGAK